MITIANTQVWVHDQEEALAFYTQKLGMEVRADVTLPEMGDFRWLTVGPVGQPDISIVLMAIPGPPVMDAETAEQVRDLMAQGLRRHGVPHDRRLPGLLRGAEGPRRRVRRQARAAAVRHRRRVPRSVRQQLPPHAGGGGAGRANRLRAPLAAGGPRVGLLVAIEQLQEVDRAERLNISTPPGEAGRGPELDLERRPHVAAVVEPGPQHLVLVGAPARPPLLIHGAIAVGDDDELGRSPTPALGPSALGSFGGERKSWHVRVERSLRPRTVSARVTCTPSRSCGATPTTSR